MTVAVALALVVVATWPRRPVRGRRPTSVAPARPREVDRRLALGLLGAGVALLVSPVASVGVVGGVLWWPRWARRRAAAARRWAVVEAVPEAADLFALSVAGGQTVPLAVATVARRAPEPVAGAFAAAARSIGLGRPTADALDEVATVLGPPVRPLVDVLVAAERYGVPLGDGLARVAREARLDRRRRAEERARRVPVLLLFPLVLCVLPAFGFLTVVPLLVGALPDLPP